jgi:predicted RND superfamily exporter protein
MLLAGLKFGIGLSVGMGIVIAAILLIVCVADQIRQYRTGHEANLLKSGRRSLEEALWRNSSEAAMRARNASHRVLFRTVIQWRDTDEEDCHRKEPNYWH